MTPAGQQSAGAVSPQYQVLGHLATGGMAELYLARSVGIAGFERHVVLKRISPEHSGNHRFVTMFLDEARLAAQLHHPNIAQVHDIGRASDSYFFTMEYVHGENVRDLLQRVAALKRQIPIEHVLTVIAGAAAGLHYAHEKLGLDRRPLHIVHRDVSPSNLMVAYEGAVKLVDFGIAKAADRMTETLAGAVKGKVAYMSPEQCTGGVLDRRSDIFSLGIILWEMLTMTRLFKHASDYETMSSIVDGAVAPPSSHRAEVPPALDRLALRALARRPGDRFQSAGEMLVAIEELAARERLSLTTTGVGRYLRELFGERPEPWYELGAASEHPSLVTVETTSADLALAVEPDPFGPQSTVRPLTGGRPRQDEWRPSSYPASRAAAPTEPARIVAAPTEPVRAVAAPPEPVRAVVAPTGPVPADVAAADGIPRAPRLPPGRMRASSPSNLPLPPPLETGPIVVGTAADDLDASMDAVTLVAPMAIEHREAVARALSAADPRAPSPDVGAVRSPRGAGVAPAPIAATASAFDLDTIDLRPSRRWMLWAAVAAVAAALLGVVLGSQPARSSGAPDPRAPTTAPSIAPATPPPPAVLPAPGAAAAAGLDPGLVPDANVPSVAPAPADPAASAGPSEPRPSVTPDRPARAIPPRAAPRTRPSRAPAARGARTRPDEPAARCGDALGLYPPCG